MKKLVILFLFFITFSVPVFAQQEKYFNSYYADLSCGFLFNSEIVSQYRDMISLGVGFITVHDRFLIGGTIGFGLVFGYDSVGKAEFDYECPHDDYTIIGENINGFTLNLFPEIGYRIIHTKFVSLDLLAGFGVVLGSMGSNYVAKSNVTGWTYTHGQGDGYSIVRSDAGVRLSMISQGVTFSLGYATARGYVLTVGFTHDILRTFSDIRAKNLK